MIMRVFLQNSKSLDNAKFAELEKNIYGPNLHLGQQWKGRNAGSPWAEAQVGGEGAGWAGSGGNDAVNGRCGTWRWSSSSHAEAGEQRDEEVRHAGVMQRRQRVAGREETGRSSSWTPRANGSGGELRPGPRGRCG